MSKVRYGLRKVHRAKVTRGNNNTVTFGDPIPVYGAQSMTATPQGSDAQKVYADDVAYFVVDATNSGYTVSMQFVRLTAKEREELLGEIVDETTGVQYEVTDGQPGEYAWIFETQSEDVDQPTAFVFYDGKAKRPNIEAKTKGENVEVDTDTIEIEFIGVDLPFKGETRNFIKGFLDKTEENATQYADFFTHVVVPTPEAPVGA